MALALFEKLELATTNNEGIFKLNYFEDMVGSERGIAIRKRLERERKLEIKASGQIVGQKWDNVRQEIRVYIKIQEII